MRIHVSNYVNERFNRYGTFLPKLDSTATGISSIIQRHPRHIYCITKILRRFLGLAYV